MPLPEPVDLASVSQVVACLEAGTRANFEAACRVGSIDHVRGPGTLVATGDLHDNPVHFQRVIEMARLDSDVEGVEPAHLTLHELIHGEKLHEGMDPSYRVLVRAAALKAANPEHVHVLLANHELSQIAGRGVLKNGVNCVKAFNDAVAYVFGDDGPEVSAALNAFIRSMPLALRCTPVEGSGGSSTGGDILCAHSLPGDAELEKFDFDILSRPLNESDYQPRVGSAHLMTWGRGQSAATLNALSLRWGVAVFILGHERADMGWARVEPNGLVLNTDHDRACVCRIDLQSRASLEVVAAGIEQVALFER